MLAPVRSQSHPCSITENTNPRHLRVARVRSVRVCGPSVRGEGAGPGAFARKPCSDEDDQSLARSRLVLHQHPNPRFGLSVAASIRARTLRQLDDRSGPAPKRRSRVESPARPFDSLALCHPRPALLGSPRRERMRPLQRGVCRGLRAGRGDGRLNNRATCGGALQADGGVSKMRNLSSTRRTSCSPRDRSRAERGAGSERDHV